MNAPTTIEEQREQRFKDETAKIKALAKAAAIFAETRESMGEKRSLSEMMLWQEFQFAKAYHDWALDDPSFDYLDEVCSQLGVDHDGDEVEDAA